MIVRNTAAEARSFAFFDRGCCSRLMRFTVISTAELISSRIGIKNKVDSRSALCIASSPISIATGDSSRVSTVARRKCVWC
jgi:hypothetical protein